MDTKAIVAVAAIAVVVIAGVAVFMMNTDQDSDRQLEDMFGNEFTLKDEVKKSVIESGAALRFTSYMGDSAMGTIAGSSFDPANKNAGSTSYSYANFPESYTYLTKINSANAEKIIEINPDIVIIGCSKSKLSDDQIKLIDTLKAAGIPSCVVRYVDDVTDADFEKQVRLMGEIFGCQSRAAELLDGIKAILSDLSGRISSMSETKNVYVGGVAFMGTKGFLWSNVAYGGLLYLDPLKVSNVAKTLVPSATYQAECSFEMIYEFEKNNTIDLAILDVAGYDMTKADYASNTSAYKAVSAIRDGNFYYVLPQTSSGTLHDNTMIASYSIGKIVDSKDFGSVDLVKKSKEIYSLFLGSEKAGEKAYNGIAAYVNGITGDASLFGHVGFAA